MNRREFISTTAASAITAAIPLSSAACGTFSPAPIGILDVQAMKWHLMPAVWAMAQEYPDLSATIECPSNSCMLVIAWHREFMRHEDDPNALAIAFDYSSYSDVHRFEPAVRSLLRVTHRLPEPSREGRAIWSAREI